MPVPEGFSCFLPTAGRILLPAYGRNDSPFSLRKEGDRRKSEKGRVKKSRVNGVE
jgi:hypothetical protein